MKKTYIQPSIIIQKIKPFHMLAGSGRATGTKMGFGGNAGDGVSGDSRRGSVWDDDDEW